MISNLWVFFVFFFFLFVFSFKSVKCNPGFMSRDDATIGGNCEYGGCRPIGTENAPCICGSDGK